MTNVQIKGIVAINVRWHDHVHNNLPVDERLESEWFTIRHPRVPPAEQLYEIRAADGMVYYVEEIVSFETEDGRVIPYEKDTDDEG